MGDINEPLLTPIKSEDRDVNSKRLLSETRDKVLGEIEEYIKKKKTVNISEIARELEMNWISVESYVKEIAERWRIEDQRLLTNQRRRLSELMRRVLEKIEDREEITIGTVRDLTELMKQIINLDESIKGKEIENATDASRMVDLHFNNLILTPSMLRELEKIREERRQKDG